MLTSVALPAAAQTDDVVHELSAEALEVQYTVPTLPDSIRLSELAGTAEDSMVFSVMTYHRHILTVLPKER